MSIAIIGAKGNMASRYKAIMNLLGAKYIGIDVDSTAREVDAALTACERIIITTPTDTHVDLIRSCIPYRKPILCEKPITKNIVELKDLMDDLYEEGVWLRMVFQYGMISKSTSSQDTVYNYFKHGSDGLVWDCTQIIALAKARITLREDSPVWHCVINGEKLNIGLMDQAYIEFIKFWGSHPDQDLNEILDIHQKVHQYERDHHSEPQKRSHRDSSAFH